jgi:UDP-glucose:(heptosyl)LPS alpha-1,3-glucosyltransferase
LRVALTIERFEPGGGAENVAWTLAHRLAERGDEIVVVARRADPHSRVPVRLVRVPAAWQPARVLAFSRAAALAAPRGAFDAVHGFSRTRHQDVYRAGGGCHAEYMERTYSRTGAWLRRASPRHAVLLRLEARVFADPSQLVQCNSSLVRDAIARRHGVPAERLAVLANPVDAERFHPRRRATDGARLRAELGPPGPVWLFVGSGFRRKGLDTALRALAQAGAPDAELWVAGRDDPGPWRPLVRRLGLEPRVRFLGARSDVETLYAAGDALLLPTRYDAFANACLEAAAAGLPVVTSGANGAAEALGAGGLVVEDAEDVGGFAKALDALAGEAERRRLGAEARRAAQAHGWDAHVDAVRALYARGAR